METTATISPKRNSSSALTALSKNALYAPLESSNSKKVSSNLGEKALYTFIETISAEYHSSNSSLGIQNGANNGGQGLKARHIEQKLAQRALTLIKGGIGTSIVKSTTEIVDGEGASKKRKGKCCVMRLGGSVSNKKRKRSRSESKTIVSTDGSILVGLNQIWNKYIKTLLEKRLSSGSFDSIEIASLMSNAELIGAFVSVARSRSTSHAGKVGFVVNITKNTWKIAVVPKDGSKDIEGMIKCKNFKSIVVPKSNSTLVLKIPSSANDDPPMIRIEISGNNNQVR